VTAIGIGLVALVLSWLMRLQLGFPDSFASSTRAPTSSWSACTG
jgi:cytochrome c oxidase subunit 1